MFGLFTALPKFEVYAVHRTGFRTPLSSFCAVYRAILFRLLGL